MSNLRLTDITLAESTAITPTTLIHVVTTADTSQYSGGSSYAGTLGQVYDGLSGHCVPDLYVSNLHSCSPLYINPLSEGDVYVGSANTVTIDLSNERVGIGTGSPSAKFDVRGVSTAFTNNTVYFTNSTTTRSWILNDDGTVNHTGAFILSHANTQNVAVLNVSSPLYPNQFIINSTGGASFSNGEVNIGSNGRVGINTAPGSSANLYVVGDTSDSTEWSLYTNNSNGGGLFTVRNDGNVGIGLNSPTAKLQINGIGDTNGTTSLYIQNSGGSNTMIVKDDGGLIFGLQASTTLGSRSLTIGEQSQASGTESVALGYLASATGLQSTALGKQTTSSNTFGVSLGNNTTASGSISTVVGSQSTASGTESISVGYLTTASGSQSVSIGSQSSSTGTSSNSIGNFSKSYGNYGNTIGYNLKNDNQGGIVLGYGDLSSGLPLTSNTTNSLVLGWNSSIASFQFSKSSDSYLNGSGNVGVGLTSPTSKLHIKGTDATSSNNSLKIDDSTSSPLLYVRNDGRVSVGLSSPTAKFHVKGAGTSTSTTSFLIEDSGSSELLSVKDNSQVNLLNTPFIKFAPSNNTCLTVGYNVGNNFSANTSTGEAVVLFGLDVCKNLPSNKEATAFGSYLLNNLVSNTINNRNVVFGSSVLNNITAGTQNLVFGYNTLNLQTDESTPLRNSSYNIGISHEAYMSENTNNTALFGHNMKVQESNIVWFGGVRQYSKFRPFGSDVDSFGVSSYRIIYPSVTGVTNTPGINIDFEGTKSTGNVDGGGFVWKVSPSGSSGSTQNSLVEAMRISGNTYVGIGTSTPTEKLDVSGTTKTINLSATTITASTFNLNGSQVETAWTSYVPTWTASTSPSIGDGTIEGYYKVIGKTCFVRGNIAMGSTTTYGTGEWLVGLPFPAKHPDGIQITVSILHASVAWYNGIMNGARAGYSDKTAIQYQNVGGTADSLSSSTPFAWGSGSRFTWNGSYEIA